MERVGRTRWLGSIQDLGCDRLGLHSSEIQSLLVDREVWGLTLELLPPQPSKKSGGEKKTIEHPNIFTKFHDQRLKLSKLPWSSINYNYGSNFQCD